MTANSGATGSAGCAGGGPDVRTGSYDGDGDNDTEEAGSTGNQPQATAPAGSSTSNQPRPEEFMD